MTTSPRAPIVLVHGLLGFDRVKVGPLTLLRYFPGIEDALMGAGHPVSVPNLSKTRGIVHRAGQLRAHIRATFPNERIHIIAHSMGGLDARFMISCLGMHEQVLSLTTVATPHRGCAFADWAVRRLQRVVWPVLQLCRIPTEAFNDLTTENCARFNERVPDAPGVRYRSVAGHCPRKLLPRIWWLAAGVVAKHEGPNDGIVSVQSARYGEHFEIWIGDHMNLVNRPNPRASGWGHRPNDYLRLAQNVNP